jgi:hypothetical protein
MTSQVNNQHDRKMTGTSEISTQQIDKQGHVGLAKDVDEASLASSTSSAQDGVKRIEAVSMTWTRWGLVLAYIGYVYICACHGFPAGLGGNIP